MTKGVEGNMEIISNPGSNRGDRFKNVGVVHGAGCCKKNTERMGRNENWIWRAQVTSLRAFASRVGQRPACGGCHWTRWGGRATECVRVDSPAQPSRAAAGPAFLFVCTLVLCPWRMSDLSRRHFHPHCHHSHDTSLQLTSRNTLMTCHPEERVVPHSQRLPQVPSCCQPLPARWPRRPECNPWRPWERLRLLSEEGLERSQRRNFHFDF